MLLNSWLQDPTKCFEKCGILNSFQCSNANQKASATTTTTTATTKDLTAISIGERQVLNKQVNKANSNSSVLGSNSEIIVARGHTLSGRQSKTLGSLNIQTIVNQKASQKASGAKKHLSTSQLSTIEKLDYTSELANCKTKANSDSGQQQLKPDMVNPGLIKI